jgi:hypothetical protein
LFNRRNSFCNLNRCFHVLTASKEKVLLLTFGLVRQGERVGIVQVVDGPRKAVQAMRSNPRLKPRRHALVIDGVDHGRALDAINAAVCVGVFVWKNIRDPGVEYRFSHRVSPFSLRRRAMRQSAKVLRLGFSSMKAKTHQSSSTIQ